MTTITVPCVTTAPTSSLGRWVHVETRKLVDTRAARILLTVLSVGALLATVLPIIWFADLAKQLGTNWQEYITFSFIPINMLLPIVGILLVTSEWTQRTALTTFTVQPRRGQVLAAKAIAVSAVPVVAWGICLASGAIIAAVGSATAGIRTDWSVDGSMPGGLLVHCFMVAIGFAFAMLLLNPAAAIVIYNALPALLPLVDFAGSVGRDVRPWIDPQSFLKPLTAGEMTATAWAHVGVGALLWIVIPGVIGTWRQLRSEVK